MGCSNCGAEKVLAKGLCGTCYGRLRQTGSLERTNIRNAGRTCSAEGCQKAGFAKGLCPFHYGKSRRPLISVWNSLRARNPGEFPAGWQSFDVFLSDVGERPAPSHPLRRRDSAAPYSKSNVFWMDAVGLERGERGSDEYRKYAREAHLRGKFKITGVEYDAILESQGGVCAICRKADARTHHLTGNPIMMHVDHCHASDQIRGILCYRCNTAIGLLDD